MICQRIQGLLSAFLDQELNAADSAEVRSHLHDCPECADELAMMRTIKAHLASPVELEAPVGLEERLLARAYAPARRARTQWALTAAVAAGFLGWFAISPMFQPRTKLSAEVETTERFEIARDRAFQSMGDPSSPVPAIYTSSYGSR